MRYITGGLATLLLAGFLGSVLIRFGPGYEADERSLDARYSEASAQAIAKENGRDSNVFVFYGRYLSRAMHGDFGISRSYGTPVSELVRSRAMVTIQLIGLGLIAGWASGLLLAAAAAYYRLPAIHLLAETLSGAALSLPAAVFALIVFLARGPVFLVLAVAVFPRVFRYSRDLFEKAGGEARVEAARTRGIPETTIFRRYIMGPAGAPLIALA